MQRPTEAADILSQEAAEQLAEILSDAITDYTEKQADMSVGDWLKGYLNDRLTERAPEEIQSICDEIISTIDRHNEKIDSMNKAAASGISAENWFTTEVMSSGGSPGEIAKEAVACDAALNDISNSFEGEEDQAETVEIENIPESEWADEKWNSYRLKDALRETASDAAKVALKNLSDDLTSKIYQHGFKSVVTNKELLTDSLLYAADGGLKVATAGAVRVAADKSIIAKLPKETKTDVIADIAGLAIENAKVLEQIGNGEISAVEGVAKMKNNSVATVAGMFGQEKGASIGASIGATFGPAGMAVGGFVGGTVGRFVGEKLGAAAPVIVDKVCSVAKAAFSTVVNTVASVGNKVLNFFMQF